MPHRKQRWRPPVDTNTPSKVTISMLIAAMIGVLGYAALHD